MACDRWKNDWVAHLYQELEPAEERQLERHLEECDDCRRTMDSLVEARRLLADSAEPVPASPGVVVLRPSRSWWSNAWAFAAGGACAAIVFALGLAAGPWITDTPDGSALPERPAEEAESVQALSRDLRAFEDRLALLEQRPESEPLTPDRFHEELDLMEHRFKQERARDLEYVLEALTASEIRTGTWLGQTQDALDMLALRQDPRFRER